MEALSQDEELAARLMKNSAKQRKKVRSMAEWSTTVELLTSIYDRLGELTQTVAALGGAKPRQIPRAPVPETATERIRQRRRSENHRQLVARVLPNKAK